MMNWHTLSLTFCLKCLFASISVLCPVLLAAQPGWQDFTSRYFYDIVDENGNKIIFRHNSDYHIMIDGVVYSGEIPEDSLRHANPADGVFYSQFRINDFSLEIPQSRTWEIKKRTEIRVIRGPDTLFICQRSGRGSFIEKTSEVGSLQTLTPKTDFVLEFIPGRYYFPSWAKELMNSLPRFSGKARLINFSQQHFTIPRHFYDSVLSDLSHYSEFLSIDSLIVENFARGYYSVERSIRQPNYNKYPSPYKAATFTDHLYKSRRSGHIYGLLGFYFDQVNCTSFKRFFYTLDPVENEIALFYPRKSPRRFGSYQLLVDSFNTMLYLPTWHKEPFADTVSDCGYEGSLTKKVYRSANEGKRWKHDKSMTSMMNQYQLRELKFIDEQHAVGYSRRRQKSSDARLNIYYLLKEQQVVDSLQIPDTMQTHTNFDNYPLELKNDTIILASWSIDRNLRNKQTIVHQPMLVKNRGGWGFKEQEKMYFKKEQKLPVNEGVVRNFQNFQLVDQHLLLFRNGAGSLSLQDGGDNRSVFNKYHLLEKGSRIYLINRQHVYFSFEGGESWFLYPVALEREQIYFRLLTLTEAGEISYFSDNRYGSKIQGLKKMIYRFKRVEF
ncbi:MAG: hypothetical protein WBA74_06130 [Cyclobacteriaceae bacterium]